MKLNNKWLVTLCLLGVACSSVAQESLGTSAAGGSVAAAPDASAGCEATGCSGVLPADAGPCFTARCRPDLNECEVYRTSNASCSLPGGSASEPSAELCLKTGGAHALWACCAPQSDFAQTCSVQSCTVDMCSTWRYVRACECGQGRCFDPVQGCVSGQ